MPSEFQTITVLMPCYYNITFRKSLDEEKDLVLFCILAPHCQVLFVTLDGEVFLGFH